MQELYWYIVLKSGTLYHMLCALKAAIYFDQTINSVEALSKGSSLSWHNLFKLACKLQVVNLGTEPSLRDIE